MPRFASVRKPLSACFARRSIGVGLRLVRAVFTRRRLWATLAFSWRADLGPPSASDDWDCSMSERIWSRQSTPSKPRRGWSRHEVGGAVVDVVGSAGPVVETVVGVDAGDVDVVVLAGSVTVTTVLVVVVGPPGPVVEVVEDVVVVVDGGAQASPSQHGRSGLSSMSGAGRIEANGPDDRQCVAVLESVGAARLELGVDLHLGRALEQVARVGEGPGPGRRDDRVVDRDSTSTR